MRPLTGATMAFRCAVLILGSNTPFDVLERSSNALAFGEVVPIPTLCPKMSWDNMISIIGSDIIFIAKGLNYIKRLWWLKRFRISGFFLRETSAMEASAICSVPF
jgi:hypothetical protein